ncbi:hypothetical protein HZA99_06205 [Candidatus Woesearchaeota archaeon]|nr:hypothetical protein [Candidatus Woesearchaeota archaeon]
MQAETMDPAVYGNLEQLYTPAERRMVSAARTLDMCVSTALQGAAYATQLPRRIYVLAGRYVTIVDDNQQKITDKVQEGEQTALVVSGSLGTTLQLYVGQGGKYSFERITAGAMDKRVEKDYPVRGHNWLEKRGANIKMYREKLEREKESYSRMKREIDEKVEELVGSIIVQRADITKQEFEKEKFCEYSSKNQRMLHELTVNLGMQVYDSAEEQQKIEERDRHKRQITMFKERIKQVNEKLEELTRSNTKDEETLREMLVDQRLYDALLKEVTIISEETSNEQLQIKVYMARIKEGYATHNAWQDFRKYVRSAPDISGIMQAMEAEVKRIKKKYEKKEQTKDDGGAE